MKISTVIHKYGGRFCVVRVLKSVVGAGSVDDIKI